MCVLSGSPAESNLYEAIADVAADAMVVNWDKFWKRAASKNAAMFPASAGATIGTGEAKERGEGYPRNDGLDASTRFRSFTIFRQFRVFATCGASSSAVV
jgi:hypothetical protein